MKPIAGETGSAVLEFLAGAVIVLIPCVYAVLCLGSVEAATLSVESAARNAARLYVDQPTSQTGSAVAIRAVREALSDVEGLSGQAHTHIACRQSCAGARGQVTISVSTRVDLPLLPQWPATRFVTSLPIVASASQSTSRFGPVS